jgi:hypothetical protein
LQKAVANRFSNAISFCNAQTHENQQLPICCKTDDLRNARNLAPKRGATWRDYEVTVPSNTSIFTDCATNAALSRSTRKLKPRPQRSFLLPRLYYPASSFRCQTRFQITPTAMAEAKISIGLSSNSKDSTSLITKLVTMSGLRDAVVLLSVKH